MGYHYECGQQDIEWKTPKQLSKMCRNCVRQLRLFCENDLFSEVALFPPRRHNIYFRRTLAGGLGVNDFGFLEFSANFFE